MYGTQKTMGEKLKGKGKERKRHGNENIKFSLFCYSWKILRKNKILIFPYLVII